MKHQPSKKQILALKTFVSELEYLFEVQNWRSTVLFAEEDRDGFMASNSIDTEYLRYTMTIYPCFWHNPIKSRATSIVHEFCHIPMDGLYSALLDAIDGKLHNRTQIRVYAENATVRFENIIFLLLGKKKKADYFHKALEKYLLSETPIKKTKKKKRK